jgi:hypothetical protein
LLLVLAGGSACARANAPADTVPPLAHGSTSPGPADDPTPCDHLAQQYCEALPLPCARVRALLAAAAVDASQCAAVEGELAALRTGAGPEAHAAAAAESLQRLLDASALDRGRIDELLAGDETSADGPAEDAELACPPGTARSGDPPPAGNRVWCEASDGLPHGPFAAWNRRGELVQQGTYDRGRLVDPGFIVPESRDVPADAFACPHGTTTRTRVDGPERASWCERPGGTWHGPALVWRDGLVTRFALYEDGRETRSFAVTQ